MVGSTNMTDFCTASEAIAQGRQPYPSTAVAQVIAQMHVIIETLPSIVLASNRGEVYPRMASATLLNAIDMLQDYRYGREKAEDQIRQANFLADQAADAEGRANEERNAFNRGYEEALQKAKEARRGRKH